ncbi:AraC family transcriptional regulator [Paenibacillus sp. JX-17]|uniref:AraC family transcriptional regulator n=1 Tax=Paenibacillus lacisoli TaxID=3064525 RepID=A0ABT9CFT5_9BACL|nr:AraC family transcriptional regulator [Paenibacillus sp. JX-17]MDO7908136.1 AraC family transcriptional regulator [Paenibacillus sp. JX-17]
MLPTSTYSVASNPLTLPENELRVLFAGESQTKPGHALGPKLYDYYLFHYIEAGRGTFHTEEHAFELSQGDCFLIYPGQLIRYASDSEKPWRYRWAAFAGRDAERLVQEAGFLNERPILHLGPDSQVPHQISEMQQAFYSRQDHAHLTALGNLYLVAGELRAGASVLSQMDSTDNQVGRIVKQMIQYMSTQYAHPVSIEQMCASLGYNRAYLSRIFKKETGLTPVTYLLKLRIDKSRQLLRERPELSIEQVSASVGLSDALYFSRQFSRFYHMAPSVYRTKVSRKPSENQ